MFQDLSLNKLRQETRNNETGTINRAKGDYCKTANERLVKQGGGGPKHK